MRTRAHKNTPCRCGYTDKGRVMIAHHKDKDIIAQLLSRRKGVD